MSRKLDDIFNECYERIRSGESLESCLRSYPQYRIQLEPLLRTTFDIGRRISYIHPRPAFKHWARVRLESAQRYPRQPARAETSAVPGWLRHGWAVAVSVGIVLLLTTGSTMAASSQALPTEPLYPVKLATEQVRLAFAVSDTNKAQVETNLVEIRAAELEAVAHSGNTDEAVKAAERYNEQWERASAAITRVEGTQPQPSENIPPAVSIPTVITTPPAISTPSVVTVNTENTTPNVATTATDNTTLTTTEEQPTTTEEQPTTAEEQPTTTEEQPTTAEEQPTTTEEQPTTAEEQPTTAEEQPTTTEEQPTTAEEQPTTTTPDNSKAIKAEKLRKSLDKSTSKSLSALQDAKGKASERAKADLQKAIDKIKKSHQSHDTTTQSDHEKGKQKTDSKNHDKRSTSNTSSTHR